MGRTRHHLTALLLVTPLLATGCVEFAVGFDGDLPDTIEWGRSLAVGLEGDASITTASWTVSGDAGVLSIVDDLGEVVSDPDGESVILRADGVGQATLTVSVETSDAGSGELSAEIGVVEPADPEVTLDVEGDWVMEWECASGISGTAHYTVSPTGDPGELLLDTDDPWMPANVSLPAIGWEVVEYQVDYTKGGGCETAQFQFINCDAFCKRSAYFEFEGDTCTGWGVREGSGDPEPACPDLPLLPIPSC